jgi:hypothetical protein
MSVLLCIGISCDRQTSLSPGARSKTMAENQQRSILGVRTVKTNWYFYSAEFGEENWKIISSDGWQSKKIHRDANGKLIWEEDYYYTGKTFFTFKGQEVWESLNIHYDYGAVAFEINYSGQDTGILDAVKKLEEPPTTTQEKLSTADEILKRWGMSRL